MRLRKALRDLVHRERVCRVATAARGPRFRKIRAMLYEKYPQYPDEAALDAADSVIVEVTPTAVFAWGLEK